MSSSLPVNNDIKVPEVMNCFIPLPKISLKQMCKTHNISYRLTVEDYDLPVDSDFQETDNSQESDDSSQYVSHNSFIDENPIPQDYQKKKKKKKSLTNRLSNWEKKRKNSNQDLVSYKRQKTSDRSSCPIFDEIQENGGKTNKSQEVHPKSLKKNGQILKHVLTTNTTNSKSGKEVNHSKDKHLQNNSKGKSLRGRPTKQKERPLNDNRPKADENKTVEFLGDLFRHSDIFDEFCQCEQCCQLDELSMAFHLLMTLPEEDLPEDLRRAVIGGKPSDILPSDDEPSDQILNDFMPGIGVEDIYEQTIEDESISPYINDFFRNTSSTLPQVFSLPVIPPVVNYIAPQVSTSGLSSIAQISALDSPVESHTVLNSNNLNNT